MSAHNVNNSQCDLNMYGPDPGDGSVKCTCDEDAPVESAVGPPRAPIEVVKFKGAPPVGGPEHPHFGTGPHVVTLQGRAAATHAELQTAGREFRAAQRAYQQAEARFKAALDAHMQEIQ